jgi:EF-hand domain pair
MKTYSNQFMLTITSVVLLSSFFNATDLMARPPQNKPESKKTTLPCPRIFSIHDADQNGSLNREEYRQFVEKIKARRETTGRPMRRFSTTLRFEDIDSNNDGHLSEDEMISVLNKRLKKHRRYRLKEK